MTQKDLIAAKIEANKELLVQLKLKKERIEDQIEAVKAKIKKQEYFLSKESEILEKS